MRKPKAVCYQFIAKPLGKMCICEIPADTRLSFGVFCAESRIQKQQRKHRQRGRHTTNSGQSLHLRSSEHFDFSGQTEAKQSQEVERTAGFIANGEKTQTV